ncbi:MAG: dTDP-glucose 4,6-dehydratase [Candidatus Zixiibacteriota bacterium]|nr:MAG: dTDP-glucose 4,6-dehydratase [candidate division Zixibacteria bacterium]
MPTYLITGGCGFIGSNYIRHLHTTQPDTHIVNLDKLTYAGNPANLADLQDSDRYTFIHGDICDPETVNAVMAQYRPNVVINFAAESHVDRSIEDPSAFIRTDVEGVYRLCEAALAHRVDRFLQISTDEVYGSIESGSFSEDATLMPSSPYAASKAGGDRLAFSYWVTHQLPVLITRASNNYGPYQYPEKLIPLLITNALCNEPLPLYGDGQNVRDWLNVADHCTAIDTVLAHGEPGEVYNVGAGNEYTNLEIALQILGLLGLPDDIIQFIPDRKGHDRRYAVRTDRIRRLGWAPKTDFEEGLQTTVEWYVNNESWWQPIRNGEFKEYYRRRYQC